MRIYLSRKRDWGNTTRQQAKGLIEGMVEDVEFTIKGNSDVIVVPEGEDETQNVLNLSTFLSRYSTKRPESKKKSSHKKTSEKKNIVPQKKASTKKKMSEKTSEKKKPIPQKKASSKKKSSSKKPETKQKRLQPPNPTKHSGLQASFWKHRNITVHVLDTELGSFTFYGPSIGEYKANIERAARDQGKNVIFVDKNADVAVVPNRHNFEMYDDAALLGKEVLDSFVFLYKLMHLDWLGENHQRYYAEEKKRVAKSGVF